MDRRDFDDNGRYDRREYDRYERENFRDDEDYFDRNYNIKNDRYQNYDDRPKKKGFLDAFKKNDDEFSPYVEGSYPSNMVVSYPKTYGDIRVLIDSLKHRQPIIANLANINDESAQRILDFMSGAVYALSGSMHRVTGSIFLLTPEGMGIKIPMELKKSLENK